MQGLSIALALCVGSTPLTLEEVKDASRQQLDAIRARLDYERAQATSKGARSVIFPQLDFNLGTGINIQGPRYQFQAVPVVENGQIVGFQQTVVPTTNTISQGQFSLGLTLSQLIYDGGRWWNQIAQSGAQEEAAKGQLAEQQLSSELEAVRRFYDLLKQQLALKVFVETLGRSQQQAERAQALYEAGRGQRGAVYDAKTNVANDEINVVRQRQRIVQSRLALLQWLGRPDGDVEAVAPAQLDEIPAKVETSHAVERAREQRPLYKSLAASVRASEAGVSVARADYFPRLAGQAQYNRTAYAIEQFVDPARQHSLFLGLNLSWDLFSGFQHQANVETAQANLTQAQAQERQQIVDLEAEIGRTNNVFDTEVEVLGISQRNFDIAKEQVALEEERFSAGLGSSLEVRNAQIKYTQAQLAVLQGRADVATARAALERSVGGTP